MRVKFISSPKLDILEDLVNKHLAGLVRLDYKAENVSLNCTPWDKGVMFTAVIYEETLSERRARNDYAD